MNDNTLVDKSSKDFKQNLDIANEDWPLLDDLKQNRFLLKKKKSKIDIKNVTGDILETSQKEDETIRQAAQDDEVLISNHIAKEKPENEYFETPQIEKTVVKNSIKETVPQTVLVNVTATPAVTQKSVSAQISSNFSSIKQSNNTILKLLASGVTKLYVKKTTTLLNPVKFVAENAKKVAVAMVHLVVPALMSWYLITQINFIAFQLSKENSFVFLGYCAVFYFASLFVWVTAQVLGAGVWSMIKTAAIDIQKAGENK